MTALVREGDIYHLASSWTGTNLFTLCGEDLPIEAEVFDTDGLEECGDCERRAKAQQQPTAG